MGERTKKEPGNKLVEPDGYCRGCVYLGGVAANRTTHYCAYLLMNREPRGCDPGEGCTKKRKKKRKRKRSR